jgi:hypothetical protein
MQRNACNEGADPDRMRSTVVVSHLAESRAQETGQERIDGVPEIEFFHLTRILETDVRMKF